MPQVNFVPVSPRCSRMTHSNGVCGSASMVCRVPFTFRSNAIIYLPGIPNSSRCATLLKDSRFPNRCVVISGRCEAVSLLCCDDFAYERYINGVKTNDDSSQRRLCRYCCLSSNQISKHSTLATIRCLVGVVTREERHGIQRI